MGLEDELSAPLNYVEGVGSTSKRNDLWGRRQLSASKSSSLGVLLSWILPPFQQRYFEHATISNAVCSGILNDMYYVSSPLDKVSTFPHLGNRLYPSNILASQKKHPLCSCALLNKSFTNCNLVPLSL